MNGRMSTEHWEKLRRFTASAPDIKAACGVRNDVLLAILDDLLDARAKLAAMPQVECACHPGVRWPTEQWGKPCRITELEDALRDLTAFVAVMFGIGPDAIIPPTVRTPLGVPVKIGDIMRNATALLAPQAVRPGEHDAEGA